jgi:hypothetical protein
LARDTTTKTRGKPLRLTTLLLTIAWAGAAFIGSVSAATISLNGYSFTSVCDSVSSPANTGCSDGTASVSYSLTGSGGPSVTAFSATADAGANTFGDLTYQILVNGPGNTAQVDVSYLLNVGGNFTQPLGNDEAALLNTGATFAVGPYTIADTEIHVNASGGSIENALPPSVTDTSVNAGYSSKTGSWSGTLPGPQTITLTTGIAYNVVLRIQANCTGQGTGSSVVSCNTSASVDPTFAIDPGQLNSGEYSLLFSPGVGNGSSAPEPGTLLLLGPGLIALASLSKALRRP